MNWADEPRALSKEGADDRAVGRRWQIGKKLKLVSYCDSAMETGTVLGHTLFEHMRREAAPLNESCDVYTTMVGDGVGRQSEHLNTRYGVRCEYLDIRNGNENEKIKSKL
jgi:hypothetical protein